MKHCPACAYQNADDRIVSCPCCGAPMEAGPGEIARAHSGSGLETIPVKIKKDPPLAVRLIAPILANVAMVALIIYLLFGAKVLSSLGGKSSSATAPAPADKSLADQMNDLFAPDPPADEGESAGIFADAPPEVGSEDARYDGSTVDINNAYLVHCNAVLEGVVTVDGRRVDALFQGTDCYISRSEITHDNTILRVNYLQNGQNYTAAALCALMTQSDIYVGDYVPCDSDGYATPDFNVIIVPMTKIFYDSYLSAINDQTTDRLLYVTPDCLNDLTGRVYSDVNRQNYYDREDVQIDVDPRSVLIEDRKATYNITVYFNYTVRETGQKKNAANHQTVRIIWRDGMWQVDRCRLLSEQDFDAVRFADLD